jgi:hypothetical protein
MAVQNVDNRATLDARLSTSQRMALQAIRRALLSALRLIDELLKS